MDHVVAPPPARLLSLADLLAQPHIECAGLAHNAVGISNYIHQGAVMAFKHVVLAHLVSTGLAFDGWGRSIGGTPTMSERQ
jgi:hypothetical protein